MRGNSEFLWFIILFLLLFCGCGSTPYCPCGCGNNDRCDY